MNFGIVMRNAWKMPSGMCFDDERASPKELRNPYDGSRRSSNFYSSEPKILIVTIRVLYLISNIMLLI